MTVGERIKQRREELGWTQQELAEKLGRKSKTTVCRIEKNMEDLTNTRLMAYAKALGIPIADLVRDAEDQISFSVSDDEKDLIEKFRKIDPVSKKNVVGLVEIAYQDYLNRKKVVSKSLKEA